MRELIPACWVPYLENEFSKPYFMGLCDSIAKEYRDRDTIYPARENIFRALELCPLENVRVVIIGQDPYHGEGQADGLCFSVADGVPLPPSLKNIYKVVYGDEQMPVSGNLEHWARQGVLMLNAVLTVEKGEAGSHRKFGWQKFTNAIIEAVSKNRPDAVYMLWGNDAKKKAVRIIDSGAKVMATSHPSPLSVYRGFEECDHFRKANDYLREIGENEIVW